jgi:hypothetical protein
MNMDVRKATLVLSDDEGKGGGIYRMDVIEFQGRNWLVPEWLDYKDAKVSMPVRIVCLDLLPHQTSNSSEYQFVVSGPIPKSVVEGRAPPELAKQYLVIEKPDIRLPIRTVH